jgi:hypothetical protein
MIHPTSPFAKEKKSLADARDAVGASSVGPTADPSAETRRR